MADDTRDLTAAQTGLDTLPAPPPKKFPKGVVLGKDGKPCRSCTSFADWASQAKKSTRPISTTSGEAPSSAAALSHELNECPPDVETLGRSSWALLHSITASYPEKPTATDKTNVTSFLSLFAKLYPCWVCAEDFQAYMEKENIRVESRDEFGKWMCEAHNDVNKKLGKKIFDCTKWEERWRNGWKDGRCD